MSDEFRINALLEDGDRTGMALMGSLSIDVPLLRKTFEFIETHPEEWNQDQWVCDTGMCYAGHAVVLSGGELVPDDDGYTQPFAFGYGLDSLPPRAVDAVFHRFGGIHVSDYAQSVLGLGDGEASAMFRSDNTLDDLRDMVDDLTEKGHLADWGVEYYADGSSEFDPEEFPDR